MLTGSALTCLRCGVESSYLTFECAVHVGCTHPAGLCVNCIVDDDCKSCRSCHRALSEGELQQWRIWTHSLRDGGICVQQLSASAAFDHNEIAVEDFTSMVVVSCVSGIEFSLTATPQTSIFELKSALQKMHSKHPSPRLQKLFLGETEFVEASANKEMTLDQYITPDVIRNAQNQGLDHLRLSLVVTYYNKLSAEQQQFYYQKDAFGNAAGTEFDLGADGAFSEFRVLVGNFCPYMLPDELRSCAVHALKTIKGFQIEVTESEKEFTRMVRQSLQPGARVDYDVLWVISHCTFRDPFSDKEEFVRAVVDFSRSLRGVMLWGDNDPYFLHANFILAKLDLGTGGSPVQLVGNTPGMQVLRRGDPRQKGFFGMHLILTGIEQLYEGNTICYPNATGRMQVLATSTDDHPLISIADAVLDGPTPCGRILIDNGFTKLFQAYFQSTAGTARYISNAAVWLCFVEYFG
eukprot:ANDGO_08350.mRNA.1 hypothetical protein DICPUDRAFT_33321